MVWAKRGSKIVRKVRCTSGPRKGRMVSNAGQCSKPINLKKRMTLKKTRAKMGKRMARRAARTKRRNPVSKRVAKLNRRR